MKNTLVALLMMLSLASASTNAQSFTAGMVNGRYWASLKTSGSKTSFLLGFREGIKSGVELFASIQDEKVKEKFDVVPMLFPSNKTLTVDELIASLDRFYGEVANRSISIARVLTYVNAETTGILKPNEMADLLADFRKEAASSRIE